MPNVVFIFHVLKEYQNYQQSLRSCIWPSCLWWQSANTLKKWKTKLVIFASHIFLLLF